MLVDRTLKSENTKKKISGEEIWPLVEFCHEDSRLEKSKRNGKEAGRLSLRGIPLCYHVALGRLYSLIERRGGGPVSKQHSQFSVCHRPREAGKASGLPHLVLVTPSVYRSILLFLVHS